jgi:hypothetical protein
MKQGWAILPSSWPPTVRPAAAVVDFGAVLLSGLARADFAAMGFGDPASNYVDYFNHRGIVTLQVALSLSIVPEPSAGSQLLLVAIIAWCARHCASRQPHVSGTFFSKSAG